MTKKKQEDDTNYSFLLRCMVALTAAAIVTAGIIAAITLKSAAVATSAVVAKTLLASAFIFTPILPVTLIPIAIGAIALVFILPFLFGCNNNTYTTVRTTTPGYRSYGNYGFYPPTSVYTDPYYYDTSSTVYTSNDHIHGHPSTNGTVHGHDGSHMHGHDGSHMHDHGGSHTHGHF